MTSGGDSGIGAGDPGADGPGAGGFDSAVTGLDGADLPIRRPPGDGWLVLIGGGEFSFGDTLEADVAWIDRAQALPDALPTLPLDADPADADAEPRHVGFIPAASGSVDYGHHFSEYMEGELGQVVEVIPIYRSRDARRGRNLERIADSSAVYLGGGVADHLLEALEGQPANEALLDYLRGGGTVVAIAAAAQALGAWVRSIQVGEHVTGLSWLLGGVVEPNSNPGHDRRFRELMAQPGVTWGLGLPPGSALLLGPDGEVEVVGTVYLARPSDDPSELNLEPLGDGDDGAADDEPSDDEPAGD